MVTLAAPIVAVTVFTDRARVTRRGTIQLEAGEHTIALERVPSMLEDDSVRASGRGANVRILGVEIVTRFVTEAPEEDLSTLQQQLQTLQDRDTALADDETAEAERIEFLKTLRQSSGTNLARGVAYGKTDLGSVESMSQYLTKELEAALLRRREIAQQRRDLAREIQAAQSRLGQVQHYESYERREIHVMVEATAATELELEVVYVVHGASWEPIYDIRLVESTVNLTYQAHVRQQSGEDWPAVQLSLSTARPAVTREIPELDAWYIDRYQPLPPRPIYSPAPMAAAMAMPAQQPEGAVTGTAYAKRAMSTAPVAEVAHAEIESTGAAVTYRVARPVAVPGDGSPHKTTVTALDLDAQLDYVTAPKIAAEAYLRAKVRNTSRFILLPGQASIFHAADFVGKTMLELVAPNEEFELQLGVDDRVKVERELTERATAKAALLGNTKRTLFAYEITLTSHLAAPARILLSDQLPVPRHEEIKVKLQSASPAPTEQTGLNILKWELELQPQHKQKITFAFTVEHPRDMVLTGLNL
ncbi:MAG TPA: mucoidy inhibitor MuiA family protein [Chloroflexia bacterium]|nr:mucoidy inhibitor MuiA family protein [Chloroflexia bacterium]